MAKIANFNGKFEVVSSDWLRDKSLSLKAKGLICLLQGLPNGWSFTLEGIAKLSKDGIDATRAAINELREAGFLRWDRNRNEDGTLGDVIVEISEASKNETSVLEKPATDKPILDKPILENPRQYNTNNNRILTEENTNSITKVMAEAENQSCGNQKVNEAFDIWEKYMGYRPKNTKRNRYAAKNIVTAKDKGENWLIAMLRLLNEAQKDPYAPKLAAGIANFADLQSDWEHLLTWARRKGLQKVESKKNFKI